MTINADSFANITPVFGSTKYEQINQIGETLEFIFPASSNDPAQAIIYDKGVLNSKILPKHPKVYVQKAYESYEALCSRDWEGNCADWDNLLSSYQASHLSWLENVGFSILSFKELCSKSCERNIIVSLEEFQSVVIP